MAEEIAEITQTGGTGEVTQTGGQPKIEQDLPDVQESIVPPETETLVQDTDAPVVAEPVPSEVEPPSKVLNDDYATKVYGYIKNSPSIGTKLSFDQFKTKYFDKGDNQLKMYNAISKASLKSPTPFVLGTWDDFANTSFVEPDEDVEIQPEIQVHAPPLERNMGGTNTEIPIGDKKSTNPMFRPTDPKDMLQMGGFMSVSDTYSHYDEKNRELKQQFDIQDKQSLALERQQEEKERNNPIDPAKTFNMTENLLKKERDNRKTQVEDIEFYESSLEWAQGQVDRHESGEVALEDLVYDDIFGAPVFTGKEALAEYKSDIKEAQSEIANAKKRLNTIDNPPPPSLVAQLEQMKVERGQLEADITDLEKRMAQSSPVWQKKDGTVVHGKVALSFMTADKGRKDKALRELNKELLTKEPADFMHPEAAKDERTEALQNYVDASMTFGTWEYNKAKLMNKTIYSDMKFTDDEILAAERRYRNREKAIRQYVDLKTAPPASVTTLDGFYEYKRKKDEQISRSMVEIQRSLINSSQMGLTERISGKHEEIQSNLNSELKIMLGQLAERYEPKVRQAIKDDPAAVVVMDKYQYLINKTDDNKEKESLNNAYKKELSNVESVANVSKAHKLEIDAATQAVTEKYRKIEEEYVSSQIKGAQKQYDDGMRKWMSKQYDPKILDKNSMDAYQNNILISDEWQFGDYADKKRIMTNAWKDYWKRTSFELASGSKFDPTDPFTELGKTKKSKKTEAERETDLNRLRMSDEAEREFYFNMMDDLLFTQKGTPSTSLLKSWAEETMELVSEENDRLAKEYGKPNVTQQFSVSSVMNSNYARESGRPTSSTSVRNNMWEKQIVLGQAKESLQGIIDHPEQDKGFWNDLGDGFTSLHGYEYIPFVSGLMNLGKNINMYSVAKKMEAGEPLGYDEQLMVDSYAAYQQINEMRPPSTGYNVGKGLGHMIPFVGEFVLTLGAFTLGKKATIEAIEGVIQRKVGKEIEEKVAKGVIGKEVGEKMAVDLTTEALQRKSTKYITNSMGLAVGALAQTSVNPQHYLTTTMERMTPEVAIALSPQGDELQSVVTGQGEDFLEAFAKGFGVTYAEFFSEQLGGHLLQMPKGMFNKLVGDTEWFQRTVLGGWMRTHKFATQKAAINHIVKNKMGWHGIMGEYAEEFVNGRMSAMITGDRGVFDLDKQQEWETFLTVGIFGAPFSVASIGKAAIVGDNVELATPINVQGKQQILRNKIPRVTWEKLNGLMGVKDVNISALNDILDNSKLDKAQKDLLTQIYINNKGDAIKKDARYGEIKKRFESATGATFDDSYIKAEPMPDLDEAETEDKEDGAETAATETIKGKERVSSKLEVDSDTGQPISPTDNTAADAVIPESQPVQSVDGSNITGAQEVAEADKVDITASPQLVSSLSKAIESDAKVEDAARKLAERDGEVVRAKIPQRLMANAARSRGEFFKAAIDGGFSQAQAQEMWDRGKAGEDMTGYTTKSQQPTTAEVKIAAQKVEPKAATEAPTKLEIKPETKETFIKAAGKFKKAKDKKRARKPMADAAAELMANMTPEQVTQLKNDLKITTKAKTPDAVTAKALTTVTPEIFIEAIERITTPVAEPVKEEPAKKEEKPKKAVAPRKIKPKNKADIKRAMTEVFGLSEEESDAISEVYDAVADTWAERTGKKKADWYKKIEEVTEGVEDELFGKILKQHNLYHGSPYQFDKFLLEKIGQGEGFQAFGHGLYFTESQQVAESYAALPKSTRVKIDGEATHRTNPEFGEAITIIEDGLEVIAGIHPDKTYTSDIDVEAELDNSLTELKEQRAALDTKSLSGKFQDTQLNYLESLVSLAAGEAKEFKEFHDIELTADMSDTDVVYDVTAHKGKSPTEYEYISWYDTLPDAQRKAISRAVGDEAPKWYTDILSDKKTTGEQAYLGLVSALSGAESMVWNSSMEMRDNYDADGMKAIAAMNSHGAEATEIMLEAGIDGVIYPSEAISQGNKKLKEGDDNYVIFDSDALTIEETILLQEDEVARAAVKMMNKGRVIMYALTDPNVSSPLHELAHIFEQDLTDAERSTVLDWAGEDEWNTDVSEKFASGFEKFLSEGKAPTPKLQKAFESFRDWLQSIYNGLISYQGEAIHLNEAMRGIYDQILSAEAAPKKKPAKKRKSEAVKAAEAEAEEIEKAKEKFGKKVPRSKNPVIQNIRTKIADARKELMHTPNLNKATQIQGVTMGEYILKSHQDGNITKEERDLLVAEQKALINEWRALLNPVEELSTRPSEYHNERSIPAGSEEQTTGAAGRIDVKKRIVEEGTKPKKLKEIASNFLNKLKVSVRFSEKRSNKQWLGSFNRLTNALSVRFEGDLDTLAHEIGHYLDKTTKIREKWTDENRNKLDKELIPKLSGWGSPVPVGHPDPTHYRRGEGIAEYVRAWMFNQEEAEAIAPEFTKVFNESIPEGVKKIMQEFGADIQTLESVSAHEKAMANINMSHDRRGLTFGDIVQRFTGEYRSIQNPNFTMDGVFDKMNMKWFDRFFGFNKATQFAIDVNGVDELLPENDPRLLGRIFLGMNNKFNSIIRDGMIDGKHNRLADKKTGNAVSFKWILEPLRQGSKKELDKEIERVTTMMVSERTIELGDKAIEDSIKELQKEGWVISVKDRRKLLMMSDVRVTGIGAGIKTDIQVALDVLQELEEMRLENPKRYNNIKEAARRYRVIGEAVMDYLVEKGRLSEQEVSLTKENNEHYVALQRIRELHLGVQELSATERKHLLRGERKGAKGALGRATGFYRAYGSSKQIDDPYAGLMDVVYRGIREADRNEVVLSLVDLITPSEETEAALASVGRKVENPSELSIRVWRKGKEEIWEFQKDIAIALQDMNRAAVKLPQIMTFIPSLIRKMVTHSPTFGIRNIMRDSVNRMIITRYKNKLTDFKYNREMLNMLKVNGAHQAGFYLEDRVSYYKLMNRAKDDLLREDKSMFIKILQGSTVAVPFSRRYNNAIAGSETFNRVVEYRKVYLAEKKRLMKDFMENEGLEREEAEQRAKHNAQLKAAFEARDLMDFAVMGEFMQWINQVIPFSNAAIQGTKRGLLGWKQANTAKERAKQGALLTARFALYSVVPTLIERALIHAMGDDDEHRQLPQYVKDMFWNIKVRDNLWMRIPKPFEFGTLSSIFGRIVDKMYGDDTAFDGMGKSLYHTFIPFTEADILGGLGLPAQLMFNYDFFRERNIVPYHEQGLKLSEREPEYASELGKAAHNLGIVDARQADFLIKGMFGQFGIWGLKTWDVAAGREDREGFNPKDFGLFVNSPAVTGVDSQWVLKKTKEYGMGWNNANIAIFKDLREDYYDETTNAGRDRMAKELRDEASFLRDEWQTILDEDGNLDILKLSGTAKAKTGRSTGRGGGRSPRR